MRKMPELVRVLIAQSIVFYVVGIFGFFICLKNGHEPWFTWGIWILGGIWIDVVAWIAYNEWKEKTKKRTRTKTPRRVR